MSDEKDLKDNVKKVLNDEYAAKINFHFGGLHISGDGLGDVAYAIEKGDIKVVEDPGLPKEIRGRYNPITDTMAFRKAKFGDEVFDATVVHEAVHAFIDMTKATQTRRLADEAAAFLAEAIYLYRRVGDLRFKHNVNVRLQSGDRKEQESGHVYKACLELIAGSKLMELTKERPTVQLPPLLYQHLLQAVKGTEAYKNIGWDEKTHADGLEARSMERARPRGGGSISRATGFRKAGPVGLTDSQESSGGRSSRKPGPTGMA